MNSYDLSREWFNWCFDNPEKINPNHTAIYFFALEHCNRLGWKNKFGFPTQMVMDAIGIKKHQTYIRYFNDIVEWGFFKLVEKSKNQYSSNIISLQSAMPKKGKALDKAIINHRAKQTETIGQSNSSIIKQETNKQETSKLDTQKFLSWFNSQVKHHTSNEVKYKLISDEDLITLTNLKSTYDNDDFNKALLNMCKDTWCIDNSMITLKHFINNFDKYLNKVVHVDPLVKHVENYIKKNTHDIR